MQKYFFSKAYRHYRIEAVKWPRLTVNIYGYMERERKGMIFIWPISKAIIFEARRECISWKACLFGAVEYARLSFAAPGTESTTRKGGLWDREIGSQKRQRITILQSEDLRKCSRPSGHSNVPDMMVVFTIFAEWIHPYGLLCAQKIK